MKRIFSSLLIMSVLSLLVIPATAWGLGFADTGSGSSKIGPSTGGGDNTPLGYYEFTANKKLMTQWTLGLPMATAKAAASNQLQWGSTSETNFTEYGRGHNDSGILYWNCYVIVPGANDAAATGSTRATYYNFESREDGANLARLSNGKIMPWSVSAQLMNFFSGTTSNKAAGITGGVKGAFRPAYNTLKGNIDMTINALYPKFTPSPVGSSSFEHFLPSKGFAGNNSGNKVAPYTGFVRGNSLGKYSGVSGNMKGKPRISFDMGAIFNDLINKEGRYALYWYRMNAYERVINTFDSPGSGKVGVSVTRPRLKLKVVDKDGNLVNASWTLSFAGRNYLTAKDNATSADTVFGTRNGLAGGPAYLLTGEAITSGKALPNSYDDNNYTLTIKTAAGFSGSTTTATYQKMKNVLDGTGGAVDWSGYFGSQTVVGDTLTIRKIPFGYVTNGGTGGYYEVTVQLTDAPPPPGNPSLNPPATDIAGPSGWLNSNKTANFVFPAVVPAPVRSAAEVDGSYTEARPIEYFSWAPHNPNWMAEEVSDPRALRQIPYDFSSGDATIRNSAQWTRANAVWPSSVLSVVLPPDSGIFATRDLALAAVTVTPFGTQLEGGCRYYAAALYEVKKYDSAGSFVKLVGYQWGNMAIKDVKVYDSVGVN